MTNQLSLSNVIDISVAQVTTGLNAFNTSNLLMVSSDTPVTGFPGVGWQTYLDPTDVATDWGSDSITCAMALSVFSQQPNILLPGGYLAIAPFASMETLATAITRLLPLVQFFGVISTQVETSENMLAAAAVIQAHNIVGGFVQTSTATIASGGALDLLRTGAFTQSRGLFYDGSTDPALGYLAGYFGRGLSTNWGGSLTASTMHLKTIAGVQPDPAITQTLLNSALLAGADTYPSLQGVACNFCSGANYWFDQVYGTEWFLGALEVAGFNYLAQSSTKVPQTEAGMDGLKGAYQQVCAQAVTNGFAAPGQWNSPNTFGNQTDLYANIQQFGYYIYSAPIAQQAQSARAARQAPLVQIALKLAGAIQSSSVIVNVNP